MGLTVIVASGGRPTLARTLQSIIPQLDLYDEILCLVDQLAPGGYSSRSRMMRAAKGEHLAFVDDDDEWTPDAAQHIRAAIRENPDAVHIFRAQHPDGRTIWTERALRPGNVTAGTIVVPNRPPLGVWHGSDFSFIAATANHRPVLWHEQAISLVRP